MNFIKTLKDIKDKHNTILITLLEWALILAWALWIGQPYLDFSPDIWPAGGEFIMSIQNNYNWQMLPKCGTCFFWNGFTNGGAPAFIDLHGGWLHPISVFSTLFFGVFNGGKITFIVSIFIAGIAQWWLGKVLKIGFLARLWGALLVVAGGHLSGRMDLASMPLVISTAACSLVLPPAFQLALNGGKKSAIALGITLGLAALSGQGYMQASLIAGMTPAIAYLMVETGPTGIRMKAYWKEFALAGILALLIAAILIIPVLHNLPYLGKDIDPQFSSAQPLKYGLLNLVIDDADFLRSNLLGKLPYPYLYANYIGWIPLIFAFISILLASREYRRLFISFAIALSLFYLVSSATLMRWIMLLPFGGFAAGLRNPGVAQGLAIPLIVGMASLGLEKLIQKDWPKLTISLAKTNEAFGSFDITLKWIVLIIPMIIALKSLSDFSNLWVWTITDNSAARIRGVEALKTPDSQWVQPVFGEYFWLPAAMENNLKIRFFFRPWGLQGGELPKPYAEFSRIMEDANLPGFQKIIEDMVFLTHPENPYAYITDGQTKIPCKANAMGGKIDVSCESNITGDLVVLERQMSGWTASLDGKNSNLITDPWLRVSAPAGKHNYAFRYQPWDVPLGIALSLLGWLIAIAGLIFYSKPTNLTPTA